MHGIFTQAVFPDLTGSVRMKCVYTKYKLAKKSLDVFTPQQGLFCKDNECVPFLAFSLT